jgi:hypothetical protein
MEREMTNTAVPAPFAHEDDQFALLNFAAYRLAKAKTDESRLFWTGAFEKLGGFEYSPKERAAKQEDWG